MMKKIFTVLLMLVAVVCANAQYMQYEQDTLRITMTNNQVHDYIWGNFQSLSFSPDFTKMSVVNADNEVSYDLDKVKSITTGSSSSRLIRSRCSTLFPVWPATRCSAVAACKIVWHMSTTC